MAKLKKEDYLKFSKERLAELLVENCGTKLKKEDYLKLSRERLAELLVENDSQPQWWWTNPNTSPYSPYVPWTNPNPYTPNDNSVPSIPDCCKPGGTCTNPFGDCINCPKRYPYNYSTSISSNIDKITTDIKTEARFNKENTDSDGNPKS